MTLTSSFHFALALVITLLIPVSVIGQSEDGLDPITLLEPLENSWPTYSGDYTGRRYSALDQVTTDNVQRLTLAWTQQMNTGMPSLNGPNSPTFVGGEGTGDFTIGAQRIKGSILQVGDLLYVTAPDHVWASLGCRAAPPPRSIPRGALGRVGGGGAAV